MTFQTVRHSFAIIPLLFWSLFDLTEGGVPTPTTPQDAVVNLATIKSWLNQHPHGFTGGLTIPDEGGNRLAHWAASGGHIDVLNYLMKQGADPWDGTATAQERSALHMACHSGHVDTVRWMLREETRIKRSRGVISKIDAVNSQDKTGQNCLLLASSAGHTEMVRGLAKVNADISITTKKGGSALHVAAVMDDMDMVQTLVGVGAEVCQLNEKGQTPGDRARAEENDAIIEYLRRKEENNGCPYSARKPEKKKKKGKKGKKDEDL